MGLIFNGSSDNITASDGSLTITGLDIEGSQNINTTGIITASSVKVTGALTYEDVTNIDSVGIITARAGLHAKDDSTFYGATSGRDLLWDKSADTLNFKDNTKLKFGDSGDLEIFHDGSHSWIQDTGTGSLYIKSNQFMAIGANGETMIQATEDSGVYLRHNNLVKFETTSSGVTVTGTVAATSYTGDGSALTGITQVGGASTVGFDDNKPIYFGSEDDYKMYWNGTRMYFEPTSSSTTQQLEIVSNNQMYINSKASGLFLMSGNQNVIDIYGGGGGGVYFKHNGTQKLKLEGGNWTYLNSATVTHAGDVFIPDKIVHSGDTNTSIRFPGADQFSIETGGSERLRIDASGNTLVNVNTATAGSYTYKLLSSDNIGSGEQTFGIQYPSVVTYGLNAESNADFTIKKDGTERLRITSAGKVGINEDVPQSTLHVASTSNYVDIGLSNSTSGHTGSDGANIFLNNNLELALWNRESGPIRFATAGTERLRINASGGLLLGTTTAGQSGEADNLTLYDAGHGGITIRTGNTHNGSIYFADGTSSDQNYRGSIQYRHADDALVLKTNATERFRINSNGAFGLSGATYGSSGQVLTSAGSGSVPTWTTISAGASTGELYVKSKNGSGSASDTGDNVYAGYRSGVTLGNGASENCFYGWEAGRYVSTGDQNAFFGAQAGENTSTASHNTAMGSEALRSNQTGASNTAIGKSALRANTADNNVAIGHDAMVTNTAGSGNIAIGKLAFRSNSSGGENTIVGHQAAQANTSNRNTCLGNNALYSNTGGYDNVVIGRYAMMLSNSGNSLSTQGCTVVGTNAMYTGGGDGNIAIGNGAAYNFTSGHNNTVIGGAAFDAATTSTYTVAIGNNCLGAFNSGACESVAIGSQCAVSLTSGNENVFIGRECASNITGGSYNVVIGKGAMAGSTGSNVHSNVVLGRSAGRLITSGNNIVLGKEAAYDMTSGNQNIIMGNEAAYNLTTGGHNIIMGYQAAKNNVLTSSGNVLIGSDVCKDIHPQSGSLVAIGRYALDAYDGYGSTHGGWTVAIGHGAMGVNRNTRHSVCIGNNAGGNWNPTAGNVHEGGCVFIGGSAGGDGPTTATAAVVVGRNAYSSGNNKTGANNVAIGVRALEQATSGQHNVCMGTFAGYRITDGNQNVMIGYLAGYGYDTTNATQGGDNNCYVGDYSHSSGTNTTQENCFGAGITGKGNSTTILRGNAYNTANSSSFSTSSDRRIKKNIVDNNVGLDIIDKIQVRNFEYRTVDEITDFDNPKSAVVEEEGTQIGVIAQELEEICSSCVTIESTGVKSVDTDNITWYLVNAVKELSAEVKSLKAQLNS